MEDPVVPLERHLNGHDLAGLIWERQFEKVLLEHGWEKFQNWECFSLTEKKVDLGEPTSFFDHVHFGCTQRECQTSKDIVGNYRVCANPESVLEL